jgi:hypothetical protein
MKKYRTEAVEEAAAALVNLTIFAAVEALLEGGTVTMSAHRATTKILVVCQKERIRQLRLHDMAMKAVHDAN